ncbi:MAG: translation initiation factor IF-3 [Spirochaetes bacterium GWF1_49_6]|nr:MAG: translation initiation factor IF-3 [Spirochaetes bacterium GWF1_49_6]
MRVIGSDGSQVGVITVEEALKMAALDELDLVEISPEADPPVCKIVDFGKFVYQREKKVKEAKKKQKIIELKEMKFSPKIDKHDYQYRVQHILNFLDKGDKVKVTIRFRGREMSHTEFGFELIQKILEEVKEFCTIEKPPKLEGRSLTAVLSPLKKK